MSVLLFENALTTLVRRKKKADALPPAMVAPFVAEYNQIVDEIIEICRQNHCPPTLACKLTIRQHEALICIVKSVCKIDGGSDDMEIYKDFVNAVSELTDWHETIQATPFDEQVRIG